MNARKNPNNKPTCDCDSLWEKPDAREFIQLLEKATVNNRVVWPGYRFTNATFVIDAGKTEKGEHCLGLWMNGKAQSYARITKTLRMLTPLYSYYLNYKEMDSIPDNEFFKTSENAPEFRNWMNVMNVSSAVYMPLDFSKLPFSVPAITKVQLAVHEAFHVEVMLKYWYTGKGYWPKWDKQPDRKKVQVCYTYNDTGREMIQKELFVLADMLEALLDGKKEKACSLGHQYLNARENRYEKLTGIKTTLAGNTEGDCATAEAFFELEEGLADYESWTMLYSSGLVSRDDLLKRYRARQNDHFYLSGSMLMHAITLMSKDPKNKIISKMINSVSVDKGSLLLLFKNQLKKYCAAR
ncbi:MAG TPA: hypothetical protein VFN30_00620 [Chitinophagaceae bacterium]|nr:hypothetical protein [Chitinophagaceae bacterium]